MSVAQQQIEGGLIWAPGQSTIRSPEWTGGMPRARSIGCIDLRRLSDTPEIVVHILPSTGEHGGISGLGTLRLAPAVANAVYAASGDRMRSLPFDFAAA